VISAVWPCKAPPIVLLLFIGTISAQSLPLDCTGSESPPSLQNWLQQTRLTEHFEFQKLRHLSASSEGEDDPTRRSLQLGLLFLTKETEETKAVEQFVDVLNQYQVTNGSSLLEAIFYKLIYACDWPRSDALVNIYVLEDTVAVFLDSASRGLIIRPISQRDTVRQTITLALIPNTKVIGPSQILLKDSKLTEPNGLARRIEQFFESYFAEANQKAHLDHPQFSLEPVEPDYVGLKVAGVKRQVLPSDNYWEKIAISVEIKSVPNGQKIVCYVSGKYASGLGNRLPSEDNYAEIEESKLRGFTGTILRKLQDYISAGAP
jgi:hypothetical protein